MIATTLVGCLYLLSVRECWRFWWILELYAGRETGSMRLNMTIYELIFAVPRCLSPAAQIDSIGRPIARRESKDSLRRRPEIPVNEQSASNCMSLHLLYIRMFAKLGKFSIADGNGILAAAWSIEDFWTAHGLKPEFTGAPVRAGLVDSLTPVAIIGYALQLWQCTL